jgi:hypothetical protein
VCLHIFILALSGCQGQAGNVVKNTIKKKEIKDTTDIVIGYGFNSYAAKISNQEEIKQLEKLFNLAEYTKTEESIQQPHLTIEFYDKMGATSFYIDDKNVIKLGDGSYIKSSQINFQDLYTIYNEYKAKKK